jgi:hypothetical protein
MLLPKRAPWFVLMNSCASIEGKSGVAQIFFGSNDSTDKIYALIDGQYSDALQPIPITQPPLSGAREQANAICLGI